MANLFDSPWKIMIVALVIIVLFGSRKLPDAARSLGKSMRILKTEVQGLHEDDQSAPASYPAQAQLQSAQAQPAQQAQAQAQAGQADQQAQIAALQEQLNKLQSSVSVNADGVQTK